jgi:hypothetical protein
LYGLGPALTAVTIPLTVASQRIDPGNRLMLSITSSDLFVAFPARGTDAFYVHHDANGPSSIAVPFVPVDRVAPAGAPPNGAGFTDDPLGAICTALSLPC